MTRPAPPLASCFSASSSCSRTVKFLATTAAIVFLSASLQPCSGATYGKSLGKLSQLHHGVSGEVFAVDSRTLYIKDLTYDGEGPAAYFYAGNSKAPIINGFRVRDERGTFDLLRRYRKEDITLTLPEGKTLGNIRWFAIWCDDFSVNFGDVRIPRGFDYPKPQKLAGLNGVHGVSSEPIVVVDAQTLLIPNFSYDGEAPDAKFWVGSGPTPNSQGTRVPDENGKEVPLRRYDHKTIVLTLPGDLTVHQLGHFGVWCEAFTVDFGHVKISQPLNVPPSLKMLGVSPQSKLNCEVLEDDLAFEVRWAVAGDSVVVQLVAKLDAGQYMSFGLSPDPVKSKMVGGDVVVAWVDKETLQGYAIDYFLDAKSQCSGQRGSCPDTRIQENTNSVRLLNAAMVNGYSIVTYQRPLKASDELDVPITTNGSQAIIWAIGPLNERQEVSFHSDYLKRDQLIEFGRPPRWNCPMPDNQEQDRPTQENQEKDSGVQETAAATTRRPQRVPPTPAPASTNGAWEIPPIQCNEPEDGVFYAQMGPTGGKHGYPAITGHVGWGISWYINGLLIPEINVVRGKKYTFVVEGGLDPETPARYHPFYITDDPIGGYQHKTPEEKAKVKIFAGVKRIRGTTKLTGVGRLCNWVPDQDQPLADEFTSFGSYQRTLTLECDHGEPGIVEWTPDQNTPDTVYYQCYTHRHLGWKINVLDECDAGEGSASEVREVYAEFPGDREAEEDLDGEGSISVSSKVTPGPEFFQDHREYARNPSFIANTLSFIKNAPSSPQLIRANNHIMLESYERFKSYKNEDNSVRQGQRYTIDGYGDKNSHTLTYSPNKNSQNGEGGYQGSKKQAGVVLQGYEVRDRGQNQLHTANPKQKLIADSRTRGPIVTNYGMKYAYAHQEAPIFSRPPTRVESQNQLILVRRTVQKRRPPMQPSPRPLSLGNPPVLLVQQRPEYIVDRKKSIYRTPSSPHPSLSSKRFAPQMTKLTINDFNQKPIIESKISQAEAAALPEDNRFAQSPAKNTGFKPESVVIEGGFRPIIRTTNPAGRADDRRFDSAEDDGLGDAGDFHSLDNFEPMFIPSPPDRNQSKKLKKKAQTQSQTQVYRNKHRMEDLDDMETAADGLDARYLPPTAKPLSQAPSRGALVTADGTQVLDSSLARSIPRMNERPEKRISSSDALSRTPQFGQFRGELPPPIPGNLRPETIPQLNSQRGQKKLITPLSSRFPEPGNNPRQESTRLTLVQRSRRSPHHVPGHEGGPEDDENATAILPTDAHVASAANETHNHEGHTHDHNATAQETDFTLPNAGKLILANIEYVFLTAILYFTI